MQALSQLSYTPDKYRVLDYNQKILSLFKSQQNFFSGEQSNHRI